MRSRNFLLNFAVLLFFLFIPYFVHYGKVPMTHDIYDEWRSISSYSISNDGKWILYLDVPRNGDAALLVKKAREEKEFSICIGYTGAGTMSHTVSKPTFCHESMSVAFMVSSSQETIKENGNNRSLALMCLDDGSTEIIERVRSFSMPEDAGGHIAYMLEKEDVVNEENDHATEVQEHTEIIDEEKEIQQSNDSKEDGSKLVVRAFDNSEKLEIPFVIDYKWTRNGDHLIYTVSAKDPEYEDGIFVLEMQGKISRALLSGDGSYKNISFNKDGSILGFFSNRDDWKSERPQYSLYGWTIGSKDPAELWVSNTATPNFPDGMQICEKSGLKFSDNGKVALFNLKRNADTLSGPDDNAIAVELWHWDDPYPYPQQKRMANNTRLNTYSAVYQIKENAFVRLSDQPQENLMLNPCGRIAFGTCNLPYAKKASYLGSFFDVFVICTRTGKRLIVKQKLFRRSARLAPDGRHIIWFEDKDWFSFNVHTKKLINLTAGLEAVFYRKENDTPSGPYPYGIAGWTKDSRSVLIYDRFDIWNISADGKHKSILTQGYGHKNNLIFRYIGLDPDETEIDIERPLLLRSTCSLSRDSGFYRYERKSSQPLRRLIFSRHSYGRPLRAKNANVFLWTRESFNEYPDLWVSGPDFNDPEKQSSLGSQMEGFIWGSARLVNYLSSDGIPLKGILYKPDNFDPEKKYPLIVYIYEKLHYHVHRFRSPVPGVNINPSFYVSNGYIIWAPDIAYSTGYPGQDAKKSVIPGIQLLNQKGHVNADAIGIEGFSWGGYQALYIMTRTNIFSACIAGAPVSNMISAYNAIRWGSGVSRQIQYERGQSRIGASLWESPLRYIENSPIFWLDRVQTPILILHNDQDGAVPWHQSIELILAMRRLEKEAYLFNYTGEGHGLGKYENQKDWAIRMFEFFGHHLKGMKMPEWMKEGKRAWQQ